MAFEARDPKERPLPGDAFLLPDGRKLDIVSVEYRPSIDEYIVEYLISENRKFSFLKEPNFTAFRRLVKESRVIWVAGYSPVTH